MADLKKYLDEDAVQIALIAGITQIVITLFINDKFASLGTVDYIITIVLFGIVLGAVAYFIGKGKLTLFKLFLIGFFGVIIYNQGIILLSLINSVPFAKDLLVGGEMGILTMIVGKLKGVNK